MFMSYASRGLVVAGALAASMLFPISASALPFTIDSESSFDPTFCTVNLTCGPDNKSLTWKTPAFPVSKLTLLDLTPQAIESDGSAVRITQLTHDNVIIPAAFSYVTQILNNIKLQAGDPAAGPLLIDNSTSLEIRFTETLNSGPPCASPNPADTICDDFFDFEADGLSPLLFSSGGINYQLIFGLELGDGTFQDGIRENRIYTAEEQSSELFVTARIVSVDVPEPMTLALLGLGLLGIGFTTRQRKM